MGSGIERVYRPISENVVQFRGLYEKYQKIGAFIEKEMT